MAHFKRIGLPPGKVDYAVVTTCPPTNTGAAPGYYYQGQLILVDHLDGLHIEICSFQKPTNLGYGLQVFTKPRDAVEFVHALRETGDLEEAKALLGL